MTMIVGSALGAEATGRDAYELIERLFPLCRSLTGAGVRSTFDVLEEVIAIERTEIPSGTQIFVRDMDAGKP